jgi:branched-chain amino acid transport system substrate-binding protein
VLDGTQFAIKVLNAHGGVLGRPVELRYQDNGTNPQKAIEQATALVRDGAVFLSSPQSSAGAIAVSKAVSAKRKIPMCANSANSDDLTIKDFQPYIFQVGPNSYMESQALATKLSKEPYKRYAVITADYAAGHSGANRFKEFIKKANPAAEIVVEEYPKFGSSDYNATINKVLAAKPDYVWTYLFGSDLITFSKQAQALGLFDQMSNHFMALYDGNTLRALGQDAAAGTEGFQRAPANLLASSTPAAQEYVAGYKAAHKSAPSDWTTLAYDCVMTWAQAVDAGHSTAPEAVMQAIENHDFQSIRGPLKFGKYDHQAEVPVYIGVVTQDKALQQPVLNVTTTIPGATVRPSEQAVQQMRGG